MWISKDKLRSILAEARGAGHKDGVEFGYEKGYEAQQEEHDSLVDRQVTNKFSDMNFLVNPQHVFQVSPTGIAYLGNEPLSREKAKQLKSDATLLKETLLWDVFQNTLRQKAIDQGLKSSTKFSHVIPAKMMVYNLDVLASIVASCLKLDVDKLPDSGGSRNVL